MGPLHSTDATPSPAPKSAIGAAGRNAATFAAALVGQTQQGILKDVQKRQRVLAHLHARSVNGKAVGFAPVHLLNLKKLTGVKRAAASVYNQYGAYIARKAREISVSPTLIAATIMNETGGRASAQGAGESGDQKPVIRFEVHQFRKWTLDGLKKRRPKKSAKVQQAAWEKEYAEKAAAFDALFVYDHSHSSHGHKFRKSPSEEWQWVHIQDKEAKLARGKSADYAEAQKQEYAALEFAKTLDDQSAMQSFSMGLTQIMGFNAADAGYANAQAMFADFSTGQEAQLDGFFTFLANYRSGKCLKALQDKDYVAYSHLYNGGKPGSADNAAYAKAMETHADAYEAVTHGLPSPDAAPSDALPHAADPHEPSEHKSPPSLEMALARRRESAPLGTAPVPLVGLGEDFQSWLHGNDHAPLMTPAHPAASPNASPFTLGPPSMPWIDRFLLSHAVPAASALPPRLTALMAQARLPAADIAEARTLIAHVPDATQRGSLYEQIQAKSLYHNQRFSKSDATEADIKRHDYLKKKGSTIGDYMCNLTSLSMVMESLGIANPDAANYPEYQDYLEHVRREEGFEARTDEKGWGNVAGKLGAHYRLIGDVGKKDAPWWKTNILPEIQRGHGIMMSITGHIVRVQDVTDPGLIVDDPFGKVTLGDGSDTKATHDWSYDQTVTYEPLPPSATPAKPGKGGKAAKAQKPKFKKIVHSHANAADKNTGAGVQGEDSVWPWPTVKNHSMNWIASFFRAEEENAPGGVVTTPLFKMGLTTAGGFAPGVKKTKTAKKASPALPAVGKAVPSALGAATIPSPPLLSAISSSPLAVQRQGKGGQPDTDPGALLHGLKKQSSGFQPDSNMRGKLGGHLGFDPGGARLHTGPAAAQAARHLNAEAFTIGSDVFFGEGRYDPSSSKGLGLIAHELTHVGQQTGTMGDKTRFFTGRGGDEMEQEAQQVGERVLANAGRVQGVSVGLYDRRYESEGEDELAPSDQQRLDMISLMALTEAENLLWQRGIRGRKTLDALDIAVSLDLSRMSNQEAAHVWADAIVSAVGVIHGQTDRVSSQPIAAPTRIQRFESGEHKWLGDEGYDAAKKAYIDKKVQSVPASQQAALRAQLEAQLGQDMHRENDNKVITYGTGVALGGDFYETPEKMYGDTHHNPALSPFLGWNTDVDDLVGYFQDETQGAEAGDVGSNYRDHSIGEVYAAPHMIGLAEVNSPHFVGHNIQYYLKYHKAAIDQAMQAHAAPDTAQRDKLWDQARFTSAFADHFLTDAFSSGHMRVPREEIMQLFRKQGISDKRSGLMAKILHDYDNQHGVMVLNQRGDHWTAYGDTLLFADKDPTRQANYQVKDGKGAKTGKTGRDIALEATEDSILDLMDAYEAGAVPKSYSALDLVPSVDPKQNKQKEDLFKVFNKKMTAQERKKQFERLGLMTRKLAGAEQHDLDILLKNLDQLMGDFHKEMHTQLDQDPEMQQLPSTLKSGLDTLGAPPKPKSSGKGGVHRDALFGSTADDGPLEEAAQSVGEVVAQGLPTSNVMGQWYGMAPPSYAAGGLLVQRSPIQMASGGYVGTGTGVGNNEREEVLQAMDALHTLWSMTNAEYSAEYPTVAALPPGSFVTTPLPNTDAALTRNEAPTLAAPVAQHYLGGAVSAGVGRGQPNAAGDIVLLQDTLKVDGYLPNADYLLEQAVVRVWQVNPFTSAVGVPETLIPHTLAGIARMKAAIVAGTFARNVMAGTHAVTPTQHAQIEQILTPGSTLAPAATPPPTSSTPPSATPPPPVVVGPAAMTGRGVGGAFERAMLAALRSAVHGWAASFRAIQAQPGQPSLPVTGANDVAVAAQTEVERYFSPYIRVASRTPSGAYHPGSFSLTSKLGDQSTRPITPGARMGWTGYWMTLDGVGQNVLDHYHCIPTRSPDDTEFERVRQLYALSPANQTDIDDAIHSWPAEAGTGTVFIQPYQIQTGGIPQQRRNRWDLFTTLVHEMMHVLEHPNFGRTARTIGGSAQKYLTEGFADLMRHELWDGPGRLVSRLASTQSNPMRRQVEGTTYPYDAGVVQYHSDYAELAQARQIDSVVGHQNAKSAFFMGHTELLGLGEGTATQGGTPLTGIGQYHATDSADADTIVVGPGDTVSSLQTRTNASFGGILGPTGTPLVPMTLLASGTRVRVPGIRWVYAIQDDTLGSIARQQAVRIPDLIRANRLPPSTPESFAFTVGMRILIPIP